MRTTDLGGKKKLSIGNKASLVTQTAKNLPAIPETQVWFLGWEDPLEKGMATHSSITAWKISCIFHGKIPYSLASYSPWGCKELDTTERLTHTYGRERQREGKGKDR